MLAGRIYSAAALIYLTPIPNELIVELIGDPIEIENALLKTDDNVYLGSR
jgi:hypothetical protein